MTQSQALTQRLGGLNTAISLAHDDSLSRAELIAELERERDAIRSEIRRLVNTEKAATAGLDFSVKWFERRHNSRR